ncbi:MAG: hypothetical protein NTZ87_03675 [Candidatus Nomurabacteria bacterium]|nr:hypothetical protein [Candidatus Nomurabacteria bacterium]
MKYLKYILIVIVMIGLFSPIKQVSARALTDTEITQIAAQQAIITSTQTEFDIVSSRPAVGANLQRYNQLLAQRTAAANTIHYIQDRASQDVAPAAIQNNLNTSVTINPAAPVTSPTNTTYQLLAPLPNVGDASNNVSTTGGLSAYLNPMIKLFIGLCAVLSVVMIVVGGIEYMTSELSHTKEAGKERIMQAIFGLLIALGAYALLYTINPDLLNSDINPPNVSVSIPSGTCSIPQFTTLEDCAGKGTWTPSATVTSPAIQSAATNTSGVCSVPQFTTAEDCAGKGTWTTTPVLPGAVGTGTCSIPQHTYQGACVTAGGKWTPNK